MHVGLHRRLIEGFSLGFGFKAVTVALLGALEPLAIVPAALFVGLLEAGSLSMQRQIGVPSALHFPAAENAPHDLEPVDVGEPQIEEARPSGSRPVSPKSSGTRPIGREWTRTSACPCRYVRPGDGPSDGTPGRGFSSSTSISRVGEKAPPATPGSVKISSRTSVGLSRRRAHLLTNVLPRAI